MAASARETAVLTLAACRKQGAWSEGHLKNLLRQNHLDSREAALATRLCFGVLQNQILIDYYLGQFCTMGLDRLEVKIHCILQTAVYQLLFLDKIPPSAAVNEAVKLARAHSRNPRTPGMVNGILRAMLRRMPLPLPQGEDAVETMSLRTSHPRWLTRAFVQRLGEAGAQALLEADNGLTPVTAQVNVLRVSPEDLAAQLSGAGVSVQPHPWMPGCLLLRDTGNLELLPAFRDGLFYIQDCAARLAVTAAGLQPGQRVLDCCAAPGGKSFAAAMDLENRGEVVCCDIHPHKIKLLESGRARLGLDILRPTLQDGSKLREDWLDRFDAVLADVPCSGLGIIRKKPDIRYKDPAALERLPEIQQGILACNANYVRRGGVLLYSTCTLLQRENEDVVAGFLASRPDYELEAFCLPRWGRQEPGMTTFWPHIHDTDGFFVAKLRRKE